LARFQLALRSALHADHDESAVGCQHLHVAGQIRGAHVVEDHVSANAASGGAHLRDEVAVAVVDQDLGAQLATALELRCAPRGDGHPGAQCDRQLGRHGADAAGAAMHQQRLRWLQAGQHEHVGPDRAHHLGQRGGGTQIDAGRHRQDLTGGDAHPLGVPAPGQQRDDFVADLPAGDVGANVRDAPGALESEHVARPRRRDVLPFALQQVGPVDRRGHDLDDHVAVPGDRLGNLADPQDVDVAGPVAHDSAHRFSPFPRPVPRTGA
jgi:hypothetical protein